MYMYVCFMEGGRQGEMGREEEGRKKGGREEGREWGEGGRERGIMGTLLAFSVQWMLRQNLISIPNNYWCMYCTCMLSHTR